MDCCCSTVRELWNIKEILKVKNYNVVCYIKIQILNHLLNMGIENYICVENIFVGLCALSPTPLIITSRHPSTFFFKGDWNIFSNVSNIFRLVSCVNICHDVISTWRLEQIIYWWIVINSKNQYSIEFSELITCMWK